MNARKMHRECILVPANLAKLHRNTILTSREGLSELFQVLHNDLDRTPNCHALFQDYSTPAI